MGIDGTWIVKDAGAVGKPALDRHLTETSHGIIKFLVDVYGLDQDARSIAPLLSHDPAVGPDEARGIGRIRTAGVGQADPKGIACGVGLHGLAHNVAMYAWALLPGVVEGLEQAPHALSIELPIQLRESQIKTDQGGAPDPIDLEELKMAAGRVVLQL